MTNQNNAAQADNPQTVLSFDERERILCQFMGEPINHDREMALAIEAAVLSKLRAPVADELPEWKQISAKLARGETLTPLEFFIHENEPAGDDADDWRDQLDAALASAPVAGEPFMYGIVGPDGKAHFEEFCVSGDRTELQTEVVDHLNRDNPEDGTYSVVALFRDAAPQASAEPTTYTTRPGESVMGIALRELGNEEAWRHILACNPQFADLLPHEYFPVGTVLTLPQADKGARPCSCPSGDGSLRHPCAVHPTSATPPEQGERDAK